MAMCRTRSVPDRGGDSANRHRKKHPERRIKRVYAPLRHATAPSKHRLRGEAIQFILRLWIASRGLSSARRRSEPRWFAATAAA